MASCVSPGAVCCTVSASADENSRIAEAFIAFPLPATLADFQTRMVLSLELKIEYKSNIVICIPFVHCPLLLFVKYQVSYLSNLH